VSRRRMDYRSTSRESYEDFQRKHPSTQLTFDQWRNIVYTFNESFREYILETGEKIKFPFGFGEFSINKKKRKQYKTVNGEQRINLPIDWKKSKEKGKHIYNFNFHTEGYFFGWVWFKKTARFRNVDLWYFKACRDTSRLITHYLRVSEKYKNLYREWFVSK
jgi:nucleoid DNA-binding protein